MNIGFDVLSQTVMLVLCVMLLVVSAALLYVLWVCWRLDRDMRRLFGRPGPPEVLRDVNGRPIKERR